jgi:RNA chaperone Hfq
VSFPSNKSRKNSDPQPETGEDATTAEAEIGDSEFGGQRKLIRPVLPEGAAPLRDPQRRGFRGMLRAGGKGQPGAGADGSQAESFYLQKQMQSQTQMVFVLENGEQVEGYIEWYDRNCIKVRNSGRVLIYKSAIKYLYKASERQGDGPMTLV